MAAPQSQVPHSRILVPPVYFLVALLLMAFFHHVAPGARLLEAPRRGWFGFFEIAFFGHAGRARGGRTLALSRPGLAIEAQRRRLESTLIGKKPSRAVAMAPLEPDPLA